MRIVVTRMPPPPNAPDGILTLINEGTVDGLQMVGSMGATEVKKSIYSSRPRPPIDTSAMKNQQVWELMSGNMGVRIGPTPDVLTRTVVMEHGRRPGARRPPIDAIERWVHRKGLADGFSKQGRRRKKKGQANRERGIAFAIARSIAKKGIKARRFYARAAPRIAKAAAGILNAAIGRRLKGAE